MISASIVLLAVVLDLAAGDPPTILHPTGWMGGWIAWTRRRAPRQGSRAQFLFGALLVVLGAMVFVLPGYFGLMRLRAWNEIVYIVASAILLKTTFTLRGLISAAHEVHAALAENDLADARRLVAWHLVSRDTRELDPAHLVSATVESAAENLADSFVAPLFFFALSGVPGAIAYRFVNTADAMIGYHGATEYLGKFAARLDDALNWIPARVSGWLIVAASFAQADGRGARRVMMRDHARTASPNAGYPMSAMAGALGVQLEKVGSYQLGDATRPLTPAVVLQSLRLTFAGAIVWILGLFAVLVCWN